MSIFTVAIIFLAVVGYMLFQIIKNWQLRCLSKGMRTKDYESVVTLCHMPFTRKLLGNYTTDLYEIRSYFLAKDTKKFDDMLNQMISTNYKNSEDKKSFLDLYFHTFIIKGNEKYAKLLLEAIQAMEDEKYLRYNQDAYEVMINRRNDLIQDMENQINSKAYYGFPLGVILYMIAKQYEYLSDNERAYIYYQNAKICFHPQAIYMPYIEENIQRLTQVIDQYKMNQIQID